MKLQLITIASVSVVSFLTITIKVGEAKTNRVKPLIPIVKTTQISQRQPVVNTELLIKSITGFWQSDRYLTESQSLINAKTEIGNFRFAINTKTIAQSGGKFRAEVILIPPGNQPEQQYMIISNGQQVWTYNPESKQYSVTTVKNFPRTFVIGMSSVVFIQFPEDTRKIITQNPLDSDQILRELGLLENTQIKEEQGIIDNQQVSVYRYTEADNEFNFSAFVEPSSGIVKQLQFNEQNRRFDLLITEKILQRTPDPVITDQTFQFSPPSGAKQVQSLNIVPF